MTEHRACCDDIVKAQGDIVDLQRRADDFDAFVREIRDALQYRLPLWATFALSGLSATVGWLLASR